MFFFARHCQRCQCKCPIIECQLKCDMHSIEQDLFAHQFDVHLFMVEMAGHLRETKYNGANWNGSKWMNLIRTCAQYNNQFTCSSYCHRPIKSTGQVSCDIYFGIWMNWDDRKQRDNNFIYTCTYLSNLTHRVVDETTSFRPIMQCQSLFCFILANERWRLHAGIGEFQIFVQIIQAI